VGGIRARLFLQALSALFCPLLVLGMAGSAAGAEPDAVFQRSPTKGGAPARWNGTITEYTGKELRMTLAVGGREQVIPADKIERIETTYTPEQLGADKLFAAGKFEAALAQYANALKSAEKRNWVRRQILAQQVWCYRSLGQLGLAMRTFQALVESDPETPYFDAVPLVWMAGEPPATLERDALTWLESRESALDVLVGVSILMSGPKRARAMERANELLSHGDPRIVWLAQAQLWRGAAATASEQQLQDWDRAIEKIPPTLAAGPLYVVGAEMARRKQGDAAALRLLKLPILFPRERLLSANALMTAGDALQKTNKPEEAAGLFREVLASYGEMSDLKAEASSRLADLERAPPP